MDYATLYQALALRPLRPGQVRCRQYGDRRRERFGGFYEIELSADSKVLVLQLARTRGYERQEAHLQAELHDTGLIITYLACGEQEIDVNNPKQLQAGLKTLRRWLKAIQEMTVAERFRRQYHREVPKLGAMLKGYRKPNNVIALR